MLGKNFGPACWLGQVTLLVKKKVLVLRQRPETGRMLLLLKSSRGGEGNGQNLDVQVVHDQQDEGLEEMISVGEPGEMLASTGDDGSKVEANVGGEQDVAAVKVIRGYEGYGKNLNV